MGAIRLALTSGAAAAVATTAAIAVSGRATDVSSWAPINAVSHILWGDRAAEQEAPSWKYSATGLTLNAGAMLSWGAVYALLLGGRQRPAAQALLVGAATSAAAYIVDYYVVPRRLTPGFEKRLPSRAMFAIYASLAAGLAAGGMMTREE
jgi:hypothetical protein